MTLPISGNQQFDPNKQRYSLPLDSCVGDDGPMPAEVTLISKSGAKASAPGHYRPSGGSVTAGGSRGKAVAQGNSTPPVGYDGP
jgi:hypothetical protein